MENLAVILKEKRKSLGIRLIELSQQSGIDQALLSKYENGNRYPSEKHIIALEYALQFSYGKLRKQWLSDKIVELLAYENDAKAILFLAESRINYLKRGEAILPKELSSQLKNKLNKAIDLKNDWIDHKPLNPTQIKKLQEYFKIEYTFESNRIEGNTLTLQETQLVVNEGLTIGGKTMQEHLEAVNHAEAVDYISSLVAKKEDFSKRVLLELHFLILKGIDKENAGKYRDCPVAISGSKHVPPEPLLLEQLMEDYFLFYKKQKSILHPILLAAEMSERLVTIHPFIDGNGRTSRLVMNLILLRAGYTIANLKGTAKAKLKYYQALETAQVNHESNAYYKLIIETCITSLKNHLDLV